MPNLNQVILAGHLARDPELRFTPAGKAVCEFTLAVNNDYKEAKETSWIRCVAWGGWAESAGKMHKGDACLVNGRIKTESWDSKTTAGKKESRTTVVAFQLFALPKGEPSEGEPVRQPVQRELRPADDPEPEDPF